MMNEVSPQSSSVDSLSFRKQVLTTLGAENSTLEELLQYNDHPFSSHTLKFPLSFPLPSEAHISTWETYLKEASRGKVFDVLQNKLVQLNFPIRKGISQSEAYRAVTRRGISPETVTEATGLILEEPEKIQLIIYNSLAGKIPVIIVDNRHDFVSMVRALTRKNEPVTIPSSMGACMIAGYNNWDRIRRIREAWEAESPFNRGESHWQKKFKEIIPYKELYQDRFMLLSTGYYSAVSPSEFGLTKEKWKKISLIIRLEHECTHYLTRRLFSAMQNNVYDELLADFMGIVSAIGEYRADWFLRFMGLEEYPHYRSGGRLENYKGTPPLSDETFNILQSLVINAAKNLENFIKKSNGCAVTTLLALTSLTLEELASPEGTALLRNHYIKVKPKIKLQLKKREADFF